MKILYLTHTVTWKGGGIFFTAFHQGRYLARRGHEVTLLAISPSSRFRFSETLAEGVRIVETPDLLPGLARTGWDIWDVLSRMVFLRGQKFDIVHGFESRPVVSLPGLSVRNRLQVPLVLTWADLFGKGGRSEERAWPIRLCMSPVEDFCERYFYPKADFLITMGEPLLNMAMDRGIPHKRIIQVLHGSDTERTKAIPQEEAKKRLGNKLPPNTKFLGYLGYLWSANAGLLFETVRRIKARINHPFQLLLIGNHRVNLDKLLPGDLRDNVIETGWVSYEDVNLYLCASDVLVLPLKRTRVSDYIWPSKINDYLASGRPIVATDMRILRPMYQKLPFGHLTEDHPEALMQGIVSIMTNDEASSRFAKNSRRLAEEELCWEKIVDKVEELYSALVTKRQESLFIIEPIY